MPSKTCVIHLAGNGAQDESAPAKVTFCLTKKKEPFFQICAHGTFENCVCCSPLQYNPKYALWSLFNSFQHG